MAHRREVCSCGAVIFQCRCIGPHDTKVIPNGCGRCSQYRPTTKITVEDVEELGRKILEHAAPPAVCGNCGRDLRNLGLAEAHERFGYGKTDCYLCRLTDHPRDERA